MEKKWDVARMNFKEMITKKKLTLKETCEYRLLKSIKLPWSSFVQSLWEGLYHRSGYWRRFFFLVSDSNTQGKLQSHRVKSHTNGKGTFSPSAPQKSWLHKQQAKGARSPKSPWQPLLQVVFHQAAGWESAAPSPRLATYLSGCVQGRISRLWPGFPGCLRTTELE